MPAQLCHPRPVWWQQVVPSGVPQYGEQAEIHTYFIWSRRISFIFHLSSKTTCVWTWKTDEWLNWSCWKLLTSICITQWLLGKISKALWDRSQGNLSGYSSRGKEVYQQWWIVRTETSISPRWKPTQPPNKTFLFIPAQEQLSPPLEPESPLCSNQTAFTPTHRPDILFPYLCSSPSSPVSPKKAFSSSSKSPLPPLGYPSHHSCLHPCTSSSTDTTGKEAVGSVLLVP